MIDHPSERDFISMVRNNMIKNFPIAATDITNDHAMFGPNLDGARGKTVEQKTDRVGMDYVAVPKNFLKIHKFVTLVEYVMFVKCAPFRIKMSPGKNMRESKTYQPARLSK